MVIGHNTVYYIVHYIGHDVWEDIMLIMNTKIKKFEFMMRAIKS